MITLLTVEDGQLEKPKQDKSWAIVASNGQGEGTVLKYRGPAITCEIEDAGLSWPDLGLDDAPAGISVWEGVYVGTSYDTACGTEYDSYPAGEFRTLTEEEWAELRSAK